MVLNRAESDAMHRLLGYSQDYLDRVHKDADELRAKIEARGPPPIWYPCDSDSDFEDNSGAPMSPPQSPKDENVLDISAKAWHRRKWIDLSQGIEPRDTGFNNFETWRSHVISEHAKKPLPTSTLLKKSEVIKKSSTQAVLRPSHRLVFHPPTDVYISLTRWNRLTRSKTSKAFTFYELGHDGKTRQPLSIMSSIRPTKSTSPLLPTGSTRQRKRRSFYRVQKK